MEEMKSNMGVSLISNTTATKTVINEFLSSKSPFDRESSGFFQLMFPFSK